MGSRRRATKRSSSGPEEAAAKAPPLSREAAVKVVTEELGGAPEDIFAEWEADPFAAASIGQVHRATTRGGDAVAVKVQYPGIDKAIENDLKSLSMLESMIAPVGRRYHTKEALDEIKAVFLAELDYRHEAEIADAFRAIHDGRRRDRHPARVPRLHDAARAHAASCSAAWTTRRSASARRKTSATRRAQTIWRFMFRALFEYGLLYADPHPGNYRFLGGGSVAFLDFGCTKQIPGAARRRHEALHQRRAWTGTGTSSSARAPRCSATTRATRRLEALHRVHEDGPRAAHARRAVPAHARSARERRRVPRPQREEDRLPGRTTTLPQLAEADSHAAPISPS